MAVPFRWRSVIVSLAPLRPGAWANDAPADFAPAPLDFACRAPELTAAALAKAPDRVPSAIALGRLRIPRRSGSITSPIGSGSCPARGSSVLPSPDKSPVLPARNPAAGYGRATAPRRVAGQATIRFRLALPKHPLGHIVAPEIGGAEVAECDLGGFVPGLAHQFGEAGA